MKKALYSSLAALIMVLGVSGCDSSSSAAQSQATPTSQLVLPEQLEVVTNENN
ncbi:conserved hypothetical protein [Vibrio nigripulchritudo MADA3029]|uniref:Uncharacterized protein n=2 Tax=Vibrio nigripulchritudo TaxID=28173 RepID=U4KED6_9VIBR|nr:MULTISPECIES: hypothetical protein [Vibrio]EGU59323.1 hypothetical protein VINI7043_27930 [Vibrio nigripulchritudo ATCC 27043]UAB71576.1 hypothetical protein INR79_06680 [Vibrio sp. SCSIO 43132]CCN34983.1 conserved hypothetical protein [Vibrio nigripulchritudo AM115]CCN39656.1 conserved hypothetical protein [Vibrio nigripulchritudo FTn2]CCN49364.1 conserved hypothetical protein [Vibrio nigripulchritudo MADA3020]